VIIMGLDVATHTGVAIYTEGVVVHREVLYFPPEGGKGKTKVKHNHPSRYIRYTHYTTAIEDLLSQWAVTHVYIEGYGYANTNTLATLVELGALVREVLHESSAQWFEVPPGKLKKFVTGSGVAKKDLVILNVFRRFGIACECDDEADAVGLAFFGAAHQRLSMALPEAQLKVAHELDKG